MPLTAYLHFFVRNRRFAAFGFVLAFGSSFGQTYFIGVFGPHIQNEFALSHTHWGSIYMLITHDYRPYEMLYFFGLGGATQAILTPAAGIYGLPHFRAIETLSSHSLVVITLIYLTAVVGLRPTWRSVIKAMIAINVLMVIVTCINLLIDGNYMYTLRKPDTASLFDVLGPWPWYLFWTEFLAFGLFALLYLPIAIQDRARKQLA